MNITSKKTKGKLFMEKVSVIIPTYNRENVIERSIRSVLNQTYTNLEVIVVDDGSKDNTEKIVKSINDDRIIYYKQKNGGASSARNTGVKLASANYIAFHDSDDSWRVDKLEKQMKYLTENPHLGMIYCNYQMHKMDGTTYVVPQGARIIGNLSGDMFLTILINNTIGTPTMLMKKEIFEELGGFDTSLHCLEDWDFAVRFAELYLIGFVNEVLVDAYQMPGSVSTNGQGYFETRCKMLSKYKDVLWKNKIFDLVIGDLFKLAEKHNYLEQTKLMLAKMMSESK